MAAEEGAALEQQLHAELSGHDEASHGSDSYATRQTGSCNDAKEAGQAYRQKQQQLSGKRIAVLKASKTDAVDVAEQQRSLGAAPALPAEPLRVATGSARWMLVTAVRMRSQHWYLKRTMHCDWNCTH